MTLRVGRLERMWLPRVGGFVWTPDAFGIGKFLKLRDGRAVVEIRRSVVVSESHEYDPTDLRHAYLPLQSRVYHQRNGNWYLGRVLDRYVDSSNTSYLVKFPGFQPIELAEDELAVRCLMPLQEPAVVLASWALEAQFLADHRDVALAALADARRLSRSLGGLLSASVELLPHQIEVVRRVTEDPIQRYLLADEVGMGKTIEACALICQTLLDKPDATVVVALPEALFMQWRDELRNRFGITEDDERVRLIAFATLTTHKLPECDLLVVDEAHHLVGRASGLHTPEFERLANLAAASPKLLLLSATPVLADDNATLALLHLLDPHAYPLSDLESLRNRLRLRQEFGRVLLGLDPEAPGFLLQDVLADFAALAPDDVVGRGLVAEAEEAIASGEPDAIPRPVHALRDHITETYRLNQRLLRTRRRDVEGWEIPQRVAVMSSETDPDPSTRDAWEVLEDWRAQALSVLAHARSDDSFRDLERGCSDLFATRVEALGAGVRTFLAAMEGGAAGELALDRRIDADGALRSRAARIRAALNAGGRAAASAGLLHRALREAEAEHANATRLVAFSSDTALVEAIPPALSRLRGFGVDHLVTSRMSREEVETALKSFWSAPAPAVLICDRSGEEGLNLQACQGIVHLDVPLDPLRVEQRIGRLDRIGRASGTIRHWVQAPSVDPDSPWQQWLELLRAGFSLFDRTIADVQFVLDDVLAEAKLDLLYQRLGEPAARARVSTALSEERRRLDEQFALDRLEMGASDAGQLFERLTEAETADRKFAKAMSGWWEKVLRLDRYVPDDSSGDRFVLRWRNSTLAPREPWEQEVAATLDVPLTYERSVALEHPGTRLVRSGNPLVEVLPRFLRYDDRGTAFATWRTDPRLPDSVVGEWIGFRLTYAIELDADRIAAALGEVSGVSLGAVRRRADLLFAPWVETVFVDSLLNPVTDPDLIKILKRPYQKAGPFPGAGDTNLADARSALGDVLDARRFTELCMAVKGRRFELIESRAEYQERLAEARSRARTQLAVRAERLERRADAQRREFGREDMTWRAETLVIQAITEALDGQLARLDSVGLIVASRQPPAAGKQ